MPPDSKPKFQHDCDGCTFLGSDEKHDFYYCPQGNLPTVIARWDNDGPSYTSGLETARMIEGQKRLDHPLVKALKLAREAGLIHEQAQGKKDH
jgi:hypothetical protein